MERIDNIDLEATTARARRMTDEELIWSVYDAAEKKTKTTVQVRAVVWSIQVVPCETKS
jgi:hypothetical protein